MKYRFLKNYLSIVFVLGTLLGIFHHHIDLKTHTDCQICTIQSSIADADTPVDTLYLTPLKKIAAATLIPLEKLLQKEHLTPLQARAPPLFIS